MTKALEARNREAIQKLAQRESTVEWGKRNDLSIADRAKYYQEISENYYKGWDKLP